MIDEANLLSSSDKINPTISRNNSGVMKIQHNLIMMGFDITMVNKVITNFGITSEEAALDYLIKSDNGMWNHPFIPKEDDPNDPKINILDQPKNVMNNVLTRINTIKRTTTFNQRNSIIKDDDVKNIINSDGNNKINNDDICEICGEGKEFHNIKEFKHHVDNSEDEKIQDINILSDINEEPDLLKEDLISTNDNIVKEDEKEEEDNSDPNICQICMDEFDNPKEMETCGHKFCSECFHSYLVDRINHNQIDEIPCPKKNCKNKNLSENFFSEFLSEPEYFKFRQFKAQNEIARDSKKLFCPLCDSYAEIGEGDAAMYDSNNPDYIKTTLKCKNGHEFCSCGRPTHEGDCYHDEKEFKDLLITENIKKCPKCGFLIKKNKGCNHMTCGNPLCKYEFCWLCMQECVPNHFDYGQCAGKQFFDPDSFTYQLEQNHPCLYILFSIAVVIGIFLALIIGGIAVPGIALALFSFAIIFNEEEAQDFSKPVKIIMYFGYVCMGFAFQNIVYMAWGIVFAGLALILVAFIINLVFNILKGILKCFLCIYDNNS